MTNLQKQMFMAIFRMSLRKKYSCLSNKSFVSRFHTSQTAQKQTTPQRSVDEKTGDNPYPFMTALKENQFQVSDSFKRPGNEDAWRFQPLVMTVCLSTIFIYFFILREENELDEILSTPLYARLPGLEERDLKLNIKSLQMQGKDTSHYEQRLKTLQTGKS